jgi:hypothetical protein
LRADALNDKIRLESRGYRVVYVLEDDILYRLDATMQAAIAGTQLFSDNQ